MTNTPSPVLDLHSLRARKARLGRRFGKQGEILCVSLFALAVFGAISAGFIHQWGLVCIAAAIAVTAALPMIWWHYELSVLPGTPGTLTDRLDGKLLGALDPAQELTPVALWTVLQSQWQSWFILNRLLVHPDTIGLSLSSNNEDVAAIFQIAAELTDAAGATTIEPGYVMAAMLLASTQIMKLLQASKLEATDIRQVTAWLSRELETMRRPKPYFGGIGRDWTFGFTPILSRFGENLSLGIARYRINFANRGQAAEITAVENAFANHASGVAVIGKAGVGKTSAVWALAQRLIEGQSTPSLAYHQVISLQPSTILSAVRDAGDLEHLLVSLGNEVAHAGHIVLFLDDAALFMHNGTGSFDATNLLMQLLQNGRVPVIMALEPTDWQHLLASNSNLASLLTPVFIAEPAEPQALNIIMDTATRLENQSKTVISYPAICEAYRLSGRYNTEAAYPGKAIQLLQQAGNQVQGGVLTAHDVQQAVEQVYGVKAGNANPAEAEQLLHLEDLIHEHMIDQTYAVKAVAGALRRARAGIANPNRPIGSFLFLGPTGVGKTELAKAVAATYFGASSSLIRLDMSEYQQASDVQRLLDSGQNSGSLIMAVRQQPFSVVLLDEIEKAHPNILNLLLQLLDEGRLTDLTGRAVSFKDTVVIATSNAGAGSIRDKVLAGASLESFQAEFVDQLIASNQFRPELLNRFDELVLFGPLGMPELQQVLTLMIADINKTLGQQKLTLELTPAALQKVIEKGYDARLGARPLRRALQQAVEDPIAQKILRGETHPGEKLILDEKDLAN